MRWLLLAWLSSVLWLSPPSSASAADFAGSGRLGLGFGARWDTQIPAYAVGLSLRGDALASLARAPRLHLGPALELRSVSAESGFRSFEAAGGVAALAQLGEDVGLSLTALVGGAYRADRLSTPQLALLLGLGFRDPEARARYASDTRLFVSLHAALGSPSLYELTAGVEVDLLFVGTPFVLLYERVRARRAGG